MSFYEEVFKHYPVSRIEDIFLSIKTKEVENAISKKRNNVPLNINDFAALISEEGLNYLNELMEISEETTRKRFGKTIQMYIPMYLSNECNNICTYCGFSFENKIKRTTLTNHQIENEIQKIKENPFEHILVVTGESSKEVGLDYMLNSIELLKPHFKNISLEVQPLEQEEYLELKKVGVYSILVYQETYLEEKYKIHHPKGKKSNFKYRIETPERIGNVGMHKIGLGVLLGLENWQIDSFYCALHLDYLEKKYWKTKFSLSFPRLRPASGVEKINQFVSDKQLLQLISAYRIFKENTEISLSTRETEFFRDNVIPYGVTSISAGSKTNPGGYAMEEESLEQFEISDERNPLEFSEVIKSKGFEPVWKDWDYFNS